MENTMEHPVALVTGSARRIGAAIARTLHAAGYDVALHCHRSRGEADALARELEARRPASTCVLQADLAAFDRLPELVAQAFGRFGRLDALVNNASGFEPTPVGTTTPAQWDALMATNARAPFFLAQAAAPHLAATRGAIVNLVDIYAERPLAGHTVYCMAKAALLAMTRSLAIELAPAVRVNAVSPGAILWPEGGGEDESRTAMLERTPLGRTGTPEEVAEAVRWLLQDATYSTGQVLHLDGGRMLAG
ncbi:pteridine reductase [Lysobacter arseniciresistens ZS79]|uniref:Pteridine reductase n=1 Tax=Lysobacter arseniciresistens ZS79 TaxID=913325 RepID=A0A0A0EZX3_9GAMM|nr:pteridine reductase [Lysobacter arseniciresistens]KGM54702.1 pteridine reductase [Lysobacter arseniciresistens ZS79]